MSIAWQWSSAAGLSDLPFQSAAATAGDTITIVYSAVSGTPTTSGYTLALRILTDRSTDPVVSLGDSIFSAKTGGGFTATLQPSATTDLPNRAYWVEVRRTDAGFEATLSVGTLTVHNTDGSVSLPDTLQTLETGGTEADLSGTGPGLLQQASLGAPVTILSASLADPGADRIAFWDDSAGQVKWLTAGSGLTITGTTIESSGGSGGTWGSITGTLSSQTDLQSALDAKLATATAASTYQPLDATLTAFAALTIAANSMTIGTAADAFSQTSFAANTFPARASTGSLEAKTITDFGLSLVDDADASTARGTLGGTTVGQAFFTATNPSAITFPRANADNSVSLLSASDFRAAIGAGTSSFDGAYGSLSGIPSTLVKTDQTNVYGNFLQDFRGCATILAGGNTALYDVSDPTKQAVLFTSAITASTVRNFYLPDMTGTFVLTGGAQLLSSKTLRTTNCKFSYDASETKLFVFDASALSVGTRTYTVKDADGTLAFTSDITNSPTITTPDINGGTADSLTSLSVRSTGAAFDLLIASTEVLTGNKTLTVAMGDTSRTLTLGGNATLNGGTHSGTNTGDQTTITGNAGTATALQTARTIGGTSFDGTANIVPATITVADTTDTTCYLALFESATGDLGPKTDAGATYNASTGAITATSFVGPLTGNASTATALATARAINGVNFDGTAAITVTAAAGTLTGTTLNSTVVTSSLTSVGTIATGVWQGTAITDSYISSAATWNAKQAGDATLTALAALTIAADSLTIGTGADAFSQTTFAANTFPAKASTGSLVAKTITDFGLSLVDDADASTARTTLGLVIGTNVQAFDAALTALATGSDFVVFSGPTTSNKTFTLPNASATVLTDNAAVTVAQGGTGRATSTTAYGLIAAGTTATGAHQTIAAGATTEILVGGGAAALPVWTTATGSGSPVRATSPTLVTPALGTPSSGTLTNCTGLPVAGGGTGVASTTAYAVLCGGTTSTGALQSIASVGTSGHVLTSNGAGALPTFQAAAGGGTAATQAEMEAASSTSVFASPGRTQYHPGVAKAWCLWTSVTTTAITTSHNVTSLTDNGTGDTTVNLTTAFSSANYAVVTSWTSDISTYNRMAEEVSASRATGSFRIVTGTFGVAFQDDPGVRAVAFGDQ